MPDPGTEALPAEAAGLLASADFVAERNRLAKELRTAGRRDAADVVAALRKPPKLVIAVNRASRELPLQARAATAAAEKLGEAQAAGDRRASEEATTRLGRAVDQLADRVAADGGGDRAAVAQLIRAALTSAPLRRRLADGQLQDVPEPSGFDALAGLTITARRAASGSSEQGRARGRAGVRREKLERDLASAKEELRAVEDELRDAERAEAAARRVREAAERRVQAARGRVKRLRR